MSQLNKILQPARWLWKRTIRRLEANIQNTSSSGQAPPPNSTNLEARLESISHRINVIDSAMLREFSTTFGSQDRVEMFNTLLEELKSKFDDLRSGRSRIPPQCTSWQHWKSKACTIIGTSRQGQKSTRRFKCYDDNCNWKDKYVTLNAYINHLKRDPHNINIALNPAMEYLPKI